MKFEIKNRWTGQVQFTAEIECDDDAPMSVKIGLAVKWGIKFRANLSGADLYGANLSRANLYGANLSRANLSGANLSRADLYGANLYGAGSAALVIASTRILPEGAVIGWKKLKNGTVAKLRIPEDAKRSHAFGRKCRAEFVDVIEGEGVSIHDGVTKYAPGLRVTCNKWETNWQKECAGGIHFYITREEADA